MRAAFRFFYFATYLLFRAGEALVRLLPIETAFLLGRAGGEIAFWLLRRRRTLALANLRLAFGNEMSDAQLRATNREHFRLLGANLIAGLKSSTMQNEKLWARLDANVPQERGQHGWIALISHIGNWELFSHLGEKFPEYRFGAVYQKLANPYIDRHLRRTRARSGIALFDRRTELLKCVRFLREGGVIGVLVDQSAGYAGLWTPLFGRLTSSSTLAATLSIRTGLPVVPLAMYTTGRARWKLRIGAPVFPECDDPEILTAQINRLLEEQIRASPADWLWGHNRWKALRPHLLFARDQRRVFIPPDFAAEALDPFRILIVAPRTQDAAAATLPAIRAIADGRPDTWLAVLTPRDATDIWRSAPELRQILTWSEDEPTAALAAKIRATAQFDAAIFFDANWKTAIAVWRAGVPIRVGRKGNWFARFYNQHPPEPRERANDVAANLEIAHSIGASINRPMLAAETGSAGAGGHS
ncbi:MAG TPA: hypothetical protein VF551_00535 [Chthoniobacterales bacterium]|jgi:lauroyl/myristoyl acyltransferase